MRLNLAFVAAALGLGSIPSVLGWGAAGHEIVATVAQIYLHPAVLASVCEILYPGSTTDNTNANSSPPCHLSRVATWADQVRRQPGYRWSGTLHYIGALDDHPSETCLFPGDRGWSGRTDHNVLGAVRNVTEVINGYLVGERDVGAAEEAMKFLIHFVGDMHMPLHLTGRERGGNGAKVTFDGRVTNLHSLWDGLLIAKSLRTIPRNYTHPFPTGASAIEIESHLRGTIYDPYVRRLMYEGFGLGLATTNKSGRFSEESQEWLSCPQAPPEDNQSFWEAGQTFLADSQPSSFSSRALASGYFAVGRVVEMAKMVMTVAGMRGGKGDEKRWDDEALCPYAWAKELHELNCQFPIWPRELDQPPYNHAAYSPPRSFQKETEEDQHEHEHEYEHEYGHGWDDALFGFLSGKPRPHPDLFELDTPEYTGRLQKEWVVERLMAMAGARLAGILNGLFLEGEALKEAGEVRLPVLPLIRL